jgi:two-component sensor histidine kinase
MTTDLATIKQQIERLNHDCMQSLGGLMDDIEAGRVPAEEGLRRGDELLQETQKEVKALGAIRDQLVRQNRTGRLALVACSLLLLAALLYVNYVG